MELVRRPRPFWRRHRVNRLVGGVPEDLTLLAISSRGWTAYSLPAPARRAAHAGSQACSPPSSAPLAHSAPAVDPNRPTARPSRAPAAAVASIATPSPGGDSRHSKPTGASSPRLRVRLAIPPYAYTRRALKKLLAEAVYPMVRRRDERDSSYSRCRGHVNYLGRGSAPGPTDWRPPSSPWRDKHIRSIMQAGAGGPATPLPGSRLLRQDGLSTGGPPDMDDLFVHQRDSWTQAPGVCCQIHRLAHERLCSPLVGAGLPERHRPAQCRPASSLSYHPYSSPYDYLKLRMRAWGSGPPFPPRSGRPGVPGAHRHAIRRGDCAARRGTVTLELCPSAGRRSRTATRGRESPGAVRIVGAAPTTPPRT